MNENRLQKTTTQNTHTHTHTHTHKEKNIQKNSIVDFSSRSEARLKIFKMGGGELG